MKKFVVFAVAVILCVGVATAQTQEKRSSAGDGFLTGTGSPAAPDGTPDWFLSVNVTGVQSWDLEGDPNNEILNRMLGAGAVITGVGWDATIQSIGASWLSEATVSYADGAGAPQLFLTIGAGDDTNGGNVPTPYSSGGIIDLGDIPLPNLDISSGDLQMEFFESFDDVADAVDTDWVSGTLDLAIMGGVPVPTVPPVAMLALVILLVGLGTYLLKRRAAHSS